MIDINELRRKLGSDDLIDHIDIHANVKPVLTEILDRLEAAEKDIALKKKLIDALGLGLNAAAHERDNLRALVVMRFDHDYPPQFVQGHNLHELNEPVTAEQCRWFVAEIERLRTDCDALREKIACMEQQKPVAKVHIHQTGGNAGISWSARPINDFDSLPLLRDGDKLYLAPGAQGEKK